MDLNRLNIIFSYNRDFAKMTKDSNSKLSTFCEEQQLKLNRELIEIYCNSFADICR